MSAIFFIVVTLVIPIILPIYAIVKNASLALFLGACTFAISQLLIRLPLLNYIANHSSSYQFFMMTQPLWTLFLLALSAALFEEIGRWVAMRLFMRRFTLQNGIFFGLGHAGVEAMFIVGIPVIVAGLQVQSDTMLILSTVERLSAILIHISLSLIILYAVSKKRFVYLIYAIVIHTVINFTIVQLNTILSSSLTESILVFFSILFLLLTIIFYRRNVSDEKAFIVRT